MSRYMNQPRQGAKHSSISISLARKPVNLALITFGLQNVTLPLKQHVILRPKYAGSDHCR